MNERTCSVAGCGRDVVAKGLCSRHYQRQRRWGDPLGGPPSPAVTRVELDDHGRRQCTACGEFKESTEFDRDATCADGLRSHCKPCRSERMKAWYAANRERQAARQRGRRAADPEGAREQDRLRYQRNYDERVARAKESAHVRRARLAGAPRDRGITIEKLRNRDGDLCCYCRIQMTFEPARRKFIPTKATLEHVAPLSRGGSHTWTNVALACWQCNTRKNKSTPDEWGVSGGRKGINHQNVLPGLGADSGQAVREHDAPAVYAAAS